MYDYSKTLNPQKALIWRIIHRDNLPWVLNHGLYCGNHINKSPKWVGIGNNELIDKRAHYPVPIGCGGFLNDYVPFYFTPFSPMLYNILTGRGVAKRNTEEIIILVSSIYKIVKLGLPFVFTDKHACVQWTKFYLDIAELDKIDWGILQRRDFQRDENDPVKLERYQAEFLVYQHCPLEAIMGIICYNSTTQTLIEQWLKQANSNIPVYARTKWYF